MRYVIFWTIALTILFYITSRSAHAADYSVKFGPGIEGQTLTGATKMFGIREESYQVRGIYTAVELGGWSESTAGRSKAAFGKLQIGAKPGPETGLFGYAFFGPALISSTDTQLSTNFQFATDIGLGIRDRFTFMSCGYGHISNAGIKLPNKGRDYLLFSVGVSF
jgi:hypothetical protein